MTICIAGKNNIAVDVCEYVRTHYLDARLLAIVNKNDTGEDGWQRSYLRYIQEKNDVELVTLEQIYDIEDLMFLSTEFDRIIKPELFRTTRLFNIHFSLLPAYKGMYTSALPILNGEKQSGVTLHCIDRGIDTGDIIAQKAFPLDEEETAESLYHKYISNGTQLILKWLDKLIRNDFQAYPQKAEGSTYFSKSAIDYSNIIVNLKTTACQIDRQIRAFYFPHYQLAKVNGAEISGTIITNQKSSVKSGTILQDTEGMMCIATIDYDIILLKKSMVVSSVASSVNLLPPPINRSISVLYIIYLSAIAQRMIHERHTCRYAPLFVYSYMFFPDEIYEQVA